MLISKLWLGSLVFIHQTDIVFSRATDGQTLTTASDFSQMVFCYFFLSSLVWRRKRGERERERRKERERKGRDSTQPLGKEWGFPEPPFYTDTPNRCVCTHMYTHASKYTAINIYRQAHTYTYGHVCTHVRVHKHTRTYHYKHTQPLSWQQVSVCLGPHTREQAAVSQKPGGKLPTEQPHLGWATECSVP